MQSEQTKVLVVDDDSFIRDVLATILGENGYLVETADSGENAFAQWSSNGSFGLIISDMNMPGMSGVELITRLRQAGCDVPIIILTANNEIAVALDALKRGANDYLLKDENIQETVCISASNALEKQVLKKQNQKLLHDLEVENERLEREKALAQNVQRNILPTELRFDGLEVGSLYVPSDKIGGDFFDAWEKDGQVHCLIGDVSGHSTSSALLMAVSKGILRSLGLSAGGPVEIVQTANRMICDIVRDSGMFLSLLYGVFDRSRGELQLVSAGHNPAYLVGPTRGTLTINPTGGVLGWDAADTWTMHRIPFEAGASLVLYTDGLTESRNSAGEEFGTERLCSLLVDSAPPQKMVETVYRAVSEFNGSAFSDDLTMFIMKRLR